MEMEAESLDIDRANVALNRVIARQDLMRMIVLPDGRQQILEDVPRYEIKVVDLRGWSKDDLAAKLEATRARLSHEIRKVDQWPLFDIIAHKLDHNQTRLHISIDMLMTDAQGIAILMRDWANFYHRPDDPPAPLELSFRDYVLATSQLEQTDAYQRSREYWLAKIPHLPPAPALPLAKSVRAVTNPHFVRRTQAIEDATWDRFKAAASSKGLTPSMLLCAAYAESLTRWARNPRFSLNVTLADRLPLHPEVSQLVGNFASSILLDVDNGGRDSFETRALRLQEQLWQDLDHRYFSGVRVLRELARGQKETTAAMPVVFSSVLGGRIPQGEGHARPEGANITHSSGQTAQVSLDCQIVEQGQLVDSGGILVIWDAIEELYPDGLLDSMFEAYCDLIRRLADDDEIWHALRPRVKGVRRSGAREAAPQVDAGKTLLELFDEQAARRSDAPAVVSSAGELSYGELQRLSNKVARRLQALGTRPDTLVGIVMDKGWAEIVGVLGVLRAGAAYLPIDPALDPEQLRYRLEYGQAQVVLTTTSVDERIAFPSTVQRLRVDDEEVWRGVDDGPVPAAAGAENLACVVFTTAPNGMDRAVMLEHRSIANAVSDVIRRCEIGPDDCVLAPSALSTSLAVCDLFGTLAAGGAVIVPDAARVRDPEHWATLVEAQGVTVWSSVPTFAEMLVAELQERQQASTLRLFLVSGDQVSSSLPSRIRRAVPSARVVRLGGASETAAWHAWHPVDTLESDRGIAYGQAICNNALYVLDDSFEECPTWAEGDVFAAGIGLARGYWRNEGPTRQQFIVHPRTGERLYRMGLVGCYRPSGDVELIGRKDLEVHVHGQRVHLERVELELERHPSVRLAAARVTDAADSSRLVGYFVPEPGTSPECDDVRAFLQKRLPGYAVPDVCVAVASLPLAVDGQLERDSLPVPERPSEVGPAFVAARDEAERTLAGIWCHVLQLDSVGIDDDFFEMGGDSLLVLQVMGAAEQAGLRLSTRQLFECPTIREQAVIAESAAGGDSVSREVA
jgi:amino acid adenylation domain-containing protein